MEKVRPTKKQRELLGFIDNFIASRGYSPSYREIMQGLEYKTVSTVATHIDNLITRGHLRKRDNSARSLEVVHEITTPPASRSPTIGAAQEKWLVDLINNKFTQAEQSPAQDQKSTDELYILVGTLRILGFEGAALACQSRLKTILARKPNYLA